MIVAEQKDFNDILRSVEAFQRVAVAGCGVCVTVCMSGGEKEAVGIANLLRLAAKESGRDAVYSVATPFRQCDMEFLDEHEAELEDADCILSMACGAGVQFMTEKFPDKVVVPGLNTMFIGVNRELGYWTEMCQGCGNCVLEKTGGICPVARCSKSHFNGPCGGSGDGKCEIDKEIECGWQLIYERMKRINQLDKLTELEDVRDWSTSRDGGPRTLRREDVQL
ncbi:MAG: methylenetetrahydrofolate reductase C-terminal domain-containing protein [Oscillospiraceae bacterium]|nr:methylenetetrahydrofolate reductase C-terminal domain-containing protein [Oscillospiraceae bacterium]